MKIKSTCPLTLLIATDIDGATSVINKMTVAIPVAAN